MGAKIIKLLPEWEPERIQAVHQDRHPPRGVEDSQGDRHTETGKTGQPASARAPGDCSLGFTANWLGKRQPTS